MRPQSVSKERIPVMTRTPYPTKTNHTCELMLVDDHKKPCIDSCNPLSTLQNGIVVDTRIPVHLMTGAGETITGKIIELSGTGLQLVAGRQETDFLQSGVFGLTRHKPATVQLCFSLPSNLVPFDRVSVQCTTYCIRKAANKTVRIGMRYLDFCEGEDTLAEYLLFTDAVG